VVVLVGVGELEVDFAGDVVVSEVDGEGEVVVMAFFEGEGLLVGGGVEGDCDVYFAGDVGDEAVEEVGYLVLSRGRPTIWLVIIVMNIGNSELNFKRIL
jgi:hypothetical protein